MIRPIAPCSANNVNSTNNVTFKGNYYYKNNKELGSDVFQSCAPKAKQGFWAKVKNAVTGPINTAAANYTENKAVVMDEIYTVVDQYNNYSYDNEKDTAFDLQDFFKSSSTYGEALKKVSKIKPAEGSLQVKLGEGSYINYEEVDGKAVPVELSHGETEDEDGVINTNIHMDFSGEMYDGLKLYPEGSDIDFEADKVTVLTTNPECSGTEDLAKNLGGPFIAHNLQKTSNGVYYADSITVFHRDEKGKIKSATTYSNAKIDNTLNDSSVSAEKRIFGVEADDVYKLNISNEGIQTRAYYQNYDKYTAVVDSPEMRDDAFKTKYSTCESADAALEELPDSKARVSLNYSKSGLDGIMFTERKTVNL